jgi:hypothetical protein
MGRIGKLAFVTPGTAPMIPLSIRATLDSNRAPIVVRLNSDWKPEFTPHDGYLIDRIDTKLRYQTNAGILELDNIALDDVDGDVLLVVPERQLAQRLIRASSSHNTLLVTEQCDQLCVMCSQPPKKHHVDLFQYFHTALLLAPEGAMIGISGGEPTLYKQELFALMLGTLSTRPDLSFHVLSNGQHFTEEDVPILRQFPKGKVLWGNSALFCVATSAR